jgi:hypothetical protein
MPTTRLASPLMYKERENNVMDQFKSYTISELAEKTESFRKSFKSEVKPDMNDQGSPEVFSSTSRSFGQRRVFIIFLLGRLPDEGIWTLGITPLESMQEFDKELQVRLNKDGETVNDIHESLRKEIHKDVFEKVDKLMGLEK